MKHIFYAMLLCSFSAHAMEEQVEEHHSRIARRTEFAHGLHVERMSSNDHRLALSPDGELLAGALISWGGDTHVKIWNSTKTNPDNKEMLSIKTKQIWDGPLPSKNKRCLFWTREGADLQGPNKLIIFDIATKYEQEVPITTCNKGPFSYNGRRRFLAEQPTEKMLVMAASCQKCENHGISFIDLRAKKESSRLSLQTPGTIQLLAYNANGSYLACLSENKCLVYQNYDLRGPIKTYDLPDTLWQRETADQAIAFDEYNALHWAYARHDGQIVSHNLDTQQISLSESSGETKAFAFNPSTRQFCTSGEGVIRTWQAERVSSAALALMQKAKRNFFAQEPIGEPAWSMLPQEERDWIKRHLGYVTQRAIRTIQAKK
jgi:WD40 repeat protein